MPFFKDHECSTKGIGKIIQTCYTYSVLGGDLVSTWVAKPKAHVEDVAYLVNHAANKVIAKRELYAENDSEFLALAA